MELECLVADGYDRDVFGHVLARSRPVAEAKGRLERILPHGEALARDLFFSLYKLNVVLRPGAETSGAVLLHRRILEAVLASPGLRELRTRTELNPVECAVAMPVLADKVLAALAKEYRVGPKQLDELASLAEDEDRLARLEADRAHLEDLSEGEVDPKTKEALDESLEQDISQISRKIEKTRAEQSKLAARLTTDIEDTVDFQVRRLPQELDEVNEHLRGLGIGRGADGRVPAERRLELGQRLLASKKLQLLARLVGAFREVAFEARRRRIARHPQTVCSIQLGDHLERLLPSELLGVSRRRRALHLDFLRRLTERGLLEYELVSPANRGPMVVCVDGSGSMSGSKELWAKAVALTLMEIARRERRGCLALVFSAGDPLAEFELVQSRGSKRGSKRGGKRGDNRGDQRGDQRGAGADRAAGSPARGRGRTSDAAVLAFAEHFPRGGTSFEEPLARAVEAVSAGTYRRGDIVFITDGEAEVSDTLVATLEEKKAKHNFRVRGILVDVAGGRGEVLERFCDDVRRVSDLTADAMCDLFAEV